MHRRLNTEHLNITIASSRPHSSQLSLHQQNHRCENRPTNHISRLMKPASQATTTHMLLPCLLCCCCCSAPLYSFHSLPKLPLPPQPAGCWPACPPARAASNRQPARPPNLSKVVVMQRGGRAILPGRAEETKVKMVKLATGPRPPQSQQRCPHGTEERARMDCIEAS